MGDQASDLVPLNRTLKTIKPGISRGQYRMSIISTDYIEQILRLYGLPWYRKLERRGYGPIFIEDGAGIYGSKETLL